MAGKRVKDSRREYDSKDYRRARAEIRAEPCWLRLPGCTGVGWTADHDPPLALHHHDPGTGCCQLRPACSSCQRQQGVRVRVTIAASRRAALARVEAELARSRMARSARWARSFDDDQVTTGCATNVCSPLFPGVGENLAAEALRCTDELEAAL